MPALVLLLAGTACLALGWLVLRGFGEGLRIGRALGGAPGRTIEQAIEMARRGDRRYIRVQGRIDADDPFPDESGRPLVLRREVVEAREGSGWRTIASARRQVPFVLRDRSAEIEIDSAAVDEGLVVIRRESEGTAGEIADRFDPPVDPSLPVRYRIDQISAVEHAYAAGRPMLGADGVVRLGPGDGRPLIVTTLEIDEAMRVLGRGRRRRAQVAAVLFVVGLGLLAAAVVLAVVPILLPALVAAQSATPTPGSGGDTRSSGSGPGIVGQPLVIALGVVIIGIVSAAVAAAYARVALRR